VNGSEAKQLTLGKSLLKRVCDFSQSSWTWLQHTSSATQSGLIAYPFFAIPLRELFTWRILWSVCSQKKTKDYNQGMSGS